jgi:hypothetical protein
MCEPAHEDFGLLGTKAADGPVMDERRPWVGHLTKPACVALREAHMRAANDLSGVPFFTLVLYLVAWAGRFVFRVVRRQD